MEGNYCQHFNWFCQKILPMVYDESFSYYEVLCKLIEMVRELAKDEASLEETFNQFKVRQDELEAQFGEIVNQWAQYKEQVDNHFNNLSQELQQQYLAFENQVKGELKDMADLLDKIAQGEYLDLYWTALKNYIDNNLQNMVAGIVKYVSFGVTPDGHFVAYIPPTWDFLSFYTEEDSYHPLYGHLILRW